QPVDERDRLRADAHAQRALRIGHAIRRDAVAAGAGIDELAGARQRRRLEVAARARARVEPALRVERVERARVGRRAVGLAHDVAVVREAVARQRGEDVALGARDRARLVDVLDADEPARARRAAHRTTGRPTETPIATGAAPGA